MTQLDDLYAKLDEQEAIIARVRPRLDELRIAIGPWLRAQANGEPMDEPVELRAEQARLVTELWQARDVDATRRDLGLAENRARRLQERVDQCNAEIARLEARPESTPRAAALIREQITQEQRIRDSIQRTLDALGTPRDLLSSDSMKTGA